MSKIGNNNFSIRVGNNVVSALYYGSKLIYSGILKLFEYSYKIMGLTYITKIENSIYNLDYDT
ncbi:MAG: hypothetical protein EBU90_14360 [Proteobacteria bacterium]|nr:hypothetical protein [Pseudomonadota bacterium]NBP16016.1 hypothetical protein [bacterium]